MASPPKTLPADFFETAAQPQAAHPEASAGPPPTLPANFFDSQQGSDAASRRIAAQDDQDNNGPRVQSLASFGSDPANDPHRLNEQTTQNGRIIAAAITTPPSLGGPVRGWVPGTTAPAALSAPVKGLTNQDTSNGTYYDEQGNLYRAHHNVQGPFQPGGKGAQALQDFTTKAGQVFSGANDPDNPMESSKALGIMLGAEALPGAAAVARNPLVKKALLGASTAVNTYFAYQTGKDATGATRQAWDLYKRGDYPGMAVKLGVGGTEALLAAIGVGNLVRTAKTAIGSKAAPKPANPPQEFTLTGEPVRQPAAEQEKANATTVEQPTAAQEPKAEEEISQKPPAEVQRPAGGAQRSQQSPAGPDTGSPAKPGDAANAGAPEVSGQHVEAKTPPGGSENTLSPLEQRALRKGIPPWMDRAESAPGGAIDLAHPDSRERVAAAVADDVAAGRVNRHDLEESLVRRYGEGARAQATKIWNRALEEGKRPAGPEGPIAHEFRHDEEGASRWLLSRGSGEAIGALHDPVLGDVDLTHGFSSKTASREQGAQGLDHVRTDHPEALGHLQDVLDTATERRPEGNRYLIQNGKMGVVVSVEKFGKEKRWVLTGYGLDKAPASGTTMDAATGPQGRGGTALPPASAPETSVAPAENDVNSTRPEMPAAPDVSSTDIPEHGALPPEREEGSGDVYFGSGLGALEALLRESQAEGDALQLKRDEALKAAKAALASPEETKTGEKVREYFTSERDLWATRANQALDIAAKKILPKMQDREALGIAREFRHRPGELRDMIEGSHPVFTGENSPNKKFDMQKVWKQRERLLPVMKKAMEIIVHPTARENTADRLLTNISERTLAEGRKGGWLDSRWQPDEYVPHLLHEAGKGEAASAPSSSGRQQGKVGKFFGFGQRRSDPYPTNLHAVFNGIQPKTLDPMAAFRIHGESFAQSRATHLLEEHLAGTGLGKWTDRRHAPEGWVQLAAHSDEFKKDLPIENPQTGEPDIAHQGLFVPQFIHDALEPITDPDYTPKLRVTIEFAGKKKEIGFDKLRSAQRVLKEAKLALSGFHLVTMPFMAAADDTAGSVLRRARQVSFSGEWWKTPTGKWFLDSERDLIASGGTTSIQGGTIDAYRSLKPGSIPTKAQVIAARVGLQAAKSVADAMTRLTFENVQRKFKVVSFALRRDAWINSNPGATPEQFLEAKKGIASYVNGVYGGLHWENMGVSQAIVQFSRALFLAPDWTGSNVALLKYAADAHPSPGEISWGNNLKGALTKEEVQARLARAFWVKQFTQGMVATQALSLALTGQWSKRPFQVYMGTDEDGKEVYMNVFMRGSGGDAVNLGAKMEEHGVGSGLGVFLGGKLAPITNLTPAVFTGRDSLGREIAPKKNSFLANTVRTALFVGKELSGVPISVQNAYRQFADDDSGKYLWPERVLSVMGPPAQHVDPNREEAEEESREDRPFLEQVLDTK